MGFDCRGHENRKKIVKNYNIKPLIYTVVLPSQIKYSCAAHKELEDRYFAFEYESKSYLDERGVFFVGEKTGFDFIEILKENSENVFIPKFFNPLKLITSNQQNSRLSKTSSNSFKMTKLNKEIFNAINLLFIIWDKVPYTNIQSILEFCTTATIDTQEWAVKVVNDLIDKDYFSRTLQQMIDEIGIEKKYNFDNIIKIIKKNGWKNNIGESCV